MFRLKLRNSIYYFHCKYPLHILHLMSFLIRGEVSQLIPYARRRGLGDARENFNHCKLQCPSGGLIQNVRGYSQIAGITAKPCNAILMPQLMVSVSVFA